jgi:hypothetical protein
MKISHPLIQLKNINCSLYYIKKVYYYYYLPIINTSCPNGNISSSVLFIVIYKEKEVIEYPF